MTPQPDRHDVAIIGAGPIGLELHAALLAGGLSVLHLEARQIGHTLSWWAPQTRFFSSNERIAIAGVPLITLDGGKSTREQYLAYLRQVVGVHRLRVHTYSPVTAITRHGDGFTLRVAGPHAGDFHARRVVLATGGTDSPRLLGVPGESLPHVTHYLGEPHAYFGQRIVVIGGKNSAVEAALRCHSAGANVTLLVRAAELPAGSIKYWLMPEITGLIRAGHIRAHFGANVAAITPTTVRLTSGDDIAADFVLAMTGYVADTTLLRAAGVTLRPPADSPTHDPATMQTDVPGIYVAGTAVGGTQHRYELFIENCHVHVARIVAHLTGQNAEAAGIAPAYDRPES